MLPASVKRPVPCLTRAPVPVMTPSKRLLPPTPVLSVAAPRARVPAPASVPMRSLPPRARTAAPATVTAGSAVKRPADPRASDPS